MRIAILDDYQNVAFEVADWSRLKDRCEIANFTRPLLEEEAAKELAPFDILCTIRERMALPGNLIRRLPNLKYIVVTGKRYDAVDVGAARACGIPVSNTNVRGGGGVSELAWGLILACARNIAMEDRKMRQGGWQNSIGTSLRGRTLGVLGLGAVGRQVAKVGQAFGMNVIAWSHNLSQEAAASADARLVSKDELFQQSDVLTIHVVLSERTEGIVGHRELGMMKPTAILINTARGRIIDERALLDTLGKKMIASAGLDVFNIEPLPNDHLLRRLDNVVLTPHLGYYTREMLASYFEDAITAIEAFLNNKTINIVNA